MKIYIAACFIQQPEVREKALELEALGHTCVSTWRYETPTGGVGSEPEFEKQFRNAAEIDLDDVKRADMLVLLTGQVSLSGGKHVETGYAIALEKRVVRVGPCENVFHWQLENYPDWNSFLAQLRSEDAGAKATANS